MFRKPSRGDRCRTVACWILFSSIAGHFLGSLCLSVVSSFLYIRMCAGCAHRNHQRTKLLFAVSLSFLLQSLLLNFHFSSLHLSPPHILLQASRQNPLTIMDSAEETELRRALAQQGVLLGRQQEELAASRQAMTEMSQQLAVISHRLEQLQTSSPMVPTAPDPPNAEVVVPRRSEPRLNPPASYSGEPNSCRSFLSQCSLTFSLQPSCFSMERSRVAFVIMHLAGLARE